MSKGKKRIIAENLRRFRDELALTQREVGLLLGFNEDTAAVRVQQYESGKRTPNAITLDKMATILKKPVNAFLEESGTLVKKAGQPQQIDDEYEELKEQLKEAKRLGVDSQIHQYINFMLGQAKKTKGIGGKSSAASPDSDLVRRKRRAKKG